MSTNIDLTLAPNYKLVSNADRLKDKGAKTAVKCRLAYIDACVEYVEQIAAYTPADLNPHDVYVHAKNIVDKYNDHS